MTLNFLHTKQPEKLMDFYKFSMTNKIFLLESLQVFEPR